MKWRLVALGIGLLLIIPLSAVHTLLRASLPRLDGTVVQPGLVAPVLVARDRLGIPVVTANNRADLAFATGFVHAQDRFFQMDLSRRLAAGELAELFGPVALPHDRKARLFGFRQVAQLALQQTSPEQRAVLEAYSRGVNSGLADLRSRPWEYWLLGAHPIPWRPEDSVLVTFAMWWDLQYSSIERDVDRLRINARLDGPECGEGWKCALRFLFPTRTEWDAPNGGAVAADGGTDLDAPIPPPEILDVRARTAQKSSALQPRNVTFAELVPPRAPVDIGSNNWAVAGRLTSTGAALIADDMHLLGRVPAVWYRARLQVKASAAQPAVDLMGVTLPGAPLLVAGSNGHIAWGFTNSDGDWTQVRELPCTEASDHELRTAAAVIPLHTHQEEIRVRGQADVHLSVSNADAGILLEARPDKRACWFVRWLAARPEATNMNLMALEHATSVAQAVAAAPSFGIPHQNFVVGDRDGHIAWTIGGRVPAATGANRFDTDAGWTHGETHPSIVDPAPGRIWTANALATNDPAQQALIGGNNAWVDADYDLGARARQIRDDLLALQRPATPQDMLRIQLDDRAVFLTRWRELLLRHLDEASLSGHPARAELRGLVAAWNGRASVDSAGYRMVRAYHDITRDALWTTLVDALGVPADEPVEVPGHFEAALWQLVTRQPLHMLAAQYADWHEFLLAQVDATVAELRQSCHELADCRWGLRKPVRIRHPLSSALPGLAGFLDMPTVQLPGDHDMPRVQDGPTGASERFAVSPGHEAQGYLHIPGGQSGHPLSPYYRTGFMDWANGTPTPFLPGPAQHKLTLQPQ